MAWSTPLTAVASSALTAAQWNASVRDNLLETAAAKATASGSYFASTGPNALAERIVAADSILVSETTSSTSYADLPAGTPGPSVTVTSGARAFGFVCCSLSNTVAGAIAFAAIEVSGSSVVNADDNRALRTTSSTANASISASHVAFYTVTPGSNTFKIVYRVNGNTGTFNARRLIVMPF